MTQRRETFINGDLPAVLSDVLERLREPAIKFSSGSADNVLGCVLALTERERKMLVGVLKSVTDGETVPGKEG